MKKKCIICGDINIDGLKIDNNEICKLILQYDTF